MTQQEPAPGHDLAGGDTVTICHYVPAAATDWDRFDAAGSTPAATSTPPPRPGRSA